MTPSLGEIRSVGFNFAPVGWHLCDGTLLPISQYDALYALIGTTYGGDGVTTFALPDLRGRLAISQGQGLGRTNRVLGQNGGTESVTLITSQMPSHTHTAMASTDNGTTNVPTNNYLAAVLDNTTTTDAMLFYLPDTFAGKTVYPLAPSSVTAAGNSLPHENRMSYLAVTYIIALQGVFPSTN